MSIIREKIMLGHGRRGDDAPPVQFFATRDFEFLHVSLLRDYLAVDLGAPEASLRCSLVLMRDVHSCRVLAAQELIVTVCRVGVLTSL